MDKERYVENDFIEVWLENGIIHLRYKPEVRAIGLDVAKRYIVGDRLKVSKGERYPIIIDMNKIVAMDKETRDYFDSEESTYLLTAGALLIKSKVQMLGMNMFLKLSQTPMPTKVFTNYEKSIMWLTKFKTDYK